MTTSAIEFPIPEIEVKPAPDRVPDGFTLPLLLEVGCEEIPARFLRDAEKALGAGVQALLEDSRLLAAPLAPAVIPEVAVEDPILEIATAVTEVSLDLEASRGASVLATYSTPRRLVVRVPALLARQPDKMEEVLGPPVKVAIDAKGNYTRAAESFAKKNGARLEDLSRTITAKGEYLSLKKTTAGRPARDILAEILPAAILGLSFPKSMYWQEKSGPRFVRPIRWVLAVLGEGESAATVGFEILGVKSSNFTFGHRVYSKERLVVESFRQYAEKLRTAYVEFDRESRRQTIEAEVKVLLEDSLAVVRDADLEEWLVNSTEWPSPIRGGFDERFLHLPREILITVMRDHQKYFAVEDEKGNLQPVFATVLNVDADEMGLIRHGHERVLRARFADAEFFWDADQRLPLRDRIPLLDKVTYQAKLGSYGDKIRRMLKIAETLCASL
jgi:glycyl-tRNA synthetase beta chain